MGILTNYVKMIQLCDLNVDFSKEELKLTTDNKSADYVMVFDIDLCLFTHALAKRAEADHHVKLEKKLFDEYYLKNPSGTALPPKTMKQLFEEYGSYTEGLLSFYGKDDVWSRENCWYDIEEHIERDGELIKALNELPFEKYCFTNGFEKRARRILQKLGIEDFFITVFCVNDELEKDDKMRIRKPNPESYKFVQPKVKRYENTKIIFFDDLEENLEMARSFGWITYHITPENDIYARLKQFKQEHNSPRDISMSLSRDAYEVQAPTTYSE